MSSLLVAASLLLAATSDSPGAQKTDTGSGSAVAEETGSGPVIGLDVFTLSSAPTATSRFTVLGISGGSSGIPVLAIPAVQVGWEFDQNAFLVGLQVWVAQGSNGFSSGSNEISVPITYRRYLRHLAAYTFAPFIEGSLSMDFITPGSNIPANNSLQFGFGVDVGFGGEYLFTRNFGLMGKVLLGYQHIPAAFGAGTDINAAGFGGVLGVLVHF